MISAYGSWLIRRTLVVLAALLVLLLTRPASAVPIGEDAASLAEWARGEALPRLAARGVSAPEDADLMRELGQSLMALIAARDFGQAAARRVTDHSATYWQAVGGSHRDRQYAMAVRIALLVADGRIDDAARYYQLVGLTGTIEGPGARTLHELARPLGRRVAPASGGDVLHLADAALDRQQWGVAAIAYRVALDHLPPADAAQRDLFGHYLFCLNRLGIDKRMPATRVRFYRSVVFPAIEAQSRQRIDALSRGESASIGQAAAATD
jgi:hypothetical protein